MLDIRELFDTFVVVAVVAMWLYLIPYLIKRGWDSGANDVNPKKKKVCDVCFRDIKKINDHQKGNE